VFESAAFSRCVLRLQLLLADWLGTRAADFSQPRRERRAASARPVQLPVPSQNLNPDIMMMKPAED
jgi:hypothetical protein